MAISKADRQRLEIFFQNRACILWAKYQKMQAFSRIGSCPTICINGRIYSTAGYNMPEENRVDISLKLYMASLGNRKHLVEVTLPHELAHQIDYNLNGIPRGNKWHGKTWCDIMIAIGLPPEPYHNLSL